MKIKKGIEAFFTSRAVFFYINRSFVVPFLFGKCLFYFFVNFILSGFVGMGLRK